jgi:DNA-binding winged helix-turn-helix (wHTH) protein/Tfp pilus assembly protein PilF
MESNDKRRPSPSPDVSLTNDGTPEASSNSSTPPELVLAGWRVLGSQNRLVKGTEAIQLEPKALDVLVALAAARGATRSRDDLLAEIWPKVIVNDDSLHQAVSRLRRALAPHPELKDAVLTVPRRGYRLDWEKLQAISQPVPAPRHGPRLHPGFVLAASLLIALFLLLPILMRTGDPALQEGSPGLAEAQATFEDARERLVRGEMEAARDLLAQVLEANPHHLEARLWLAELQLKEGRIEVAQRLGRQVYLAAMDHGTDHLRMVSAALLSRLAKGDSDREQAYAYAFESLALANRLRSPFYAAAGHERIGELYLAEGKRGLAVQELEKALEGYRDNVCPASEQRVRETLSKLPQA